MASRIRPLVSGEDGVLSIPMLLLLLVFWTGIIGAVALLRNWDAKMETQLRLDQCVARKSLELKDTIEALERANVQIRILRAAIVAAQAVPEALPELRAALDAVAAYQELRKWRWNAIQAVWLAARGCSGKKDLAFPLPGVPFQRLPPDEIGPTPLERNEKVKTLRIEVFSSPRAAAAKIEETHEGSWKAAFATP